MFLVVTVDRNWAIGKNGDIPYRFPVGRAYFREAINGRTIVYSRKVLKLFPNSAPLEGAKNVILTRDPNFTCDGATIIHCLEDLEHFNNDTLCIVGGASIYRQLYKQCSYAFITHIDSVTLDCDAFFPDITQEDWKLVSCAPTLYYQGLPYRFETWRNMTIS